MTHTIEDLMASAIGQRPIDFEQSFNAIMMQRAGAAVEQRKLDMAKSLWSGEEVEEEATEEEEPVEEPEGEIEERFGGKGSDPSLRNNPPQGKPGGAAPTPPSKGTGKSDLMTSLTAVRKTTKVNEADIKGFSKNVMGGYSDATKNTNASGSGAGVQGSPGTQSGGGSIVKGRTGEADVYREGGKGKSKKKMMEAGDNSILGNTQKAINSKKDIDPGMSMKPPPGSTNPDPGMSMKPPPGSTNPDPGMSMKPQSSFKPQFEGGKDKRKK